MFCGSNAQDWAKNTLAGKLSKSDKLGLTDHSKVEYPPFRRSFYTETGALAKMTEEEVAAYRKELDDIKVILLSLVWWFASSRPRLFGCLPCHAADVSVTSRRSIGWCLYSPSVTSVRQCGLNCYRWMGRIFIV